MAPGVADQRSISDERRSSLLTQGWRRVYRRYQVIFLGLLGVMLIAVGWELICYFRLVHPFFISSPTAIAVQFKKALTTGVWFEDLAITMGEFLIGFALSVIVGIPIGFLRGWYKYVEYFIDPYVWLLYATPLIALYPLFIVILGLGSPVVITLAFLLAVIPIYTNTYTGVKTINPLLISIAKSFGASDRKIFFKIALPSSVPLIIAGLRLAVGRALLGVVIGELFGANFGVGFRLGYTAARMEIDAYFVALLTIAMIGVILSQFLLRLERLFAEWRV